jgi:hypothetical protein
VKQHPQNKLSSKYCCGQSSEKKNSLSKNKTSYHLIPSTTDFDEIWRRIHPFDFFDWSNFEDSPRLGLIEKSLHDPQQVQQRYFGL